MAKKPPKKYVVLWSLYVAVGFAFAKELALVLVWKCWFEMIRLKFNRHSVSLWSVFRTFNGQQIKRIKKCCTRVNIGVGVSLSVVLLLVFWLCYESVRFIWIELSFGFNWQFNWTDNSIELTIDLNCQLWNDKVKVQWNGIN